MPAALKNKKVNRNKTTRGTTIGLNRKWVIFDASEKPVGRLATEIAQRLTGKYQAIWSNDVDLGDCIVVINTDKLVFTGRKMDQKAYYRHSLYLGGQTKTLAKQQMEKDSTFIIRQAVSRMIPKNKMRDPRLARLHIFKNFTHPFEDKFVTPKID
jgi:large subunit ribosomal protein L13